MNARIECQVDFYDGAYGPTIRIDLLRQEGIEWFRRLLCSLTAVTTASIPLQQDDVVEITGLNSLTLVTASASPPSKEVSRTACGAFSWSRDSEGWIECIVLLDGIARHGGPCHQYAGIEGEDDAIIELAYKEKAVLG